MRRRRERPQWRSFNGLVTERFCRDGMCINRCVFGSYWVDLGSWRSLDGLRKREKASGASTWGYHRTHLGSVLVSSVVLVICRSLHVACSAYGSEVDKARALGEQRISGR
jgi:hypothetical protein